MNSFNFPIRWQCSNIFGKILSGEARICFAVTFLLLFNLTYAKRKLLQIRLITLLLRELLRNETKTMQFYVKLLLHENFVAK